MRTPRKLRTVNNANRFVPRLFRPLASLIIFCNPLFQNSDQYIEEKRFCYWRGEKVIKLTKLKLPDNFFKCVFCESLNEDRTNLNIDLVYDLIEEEKIAIKNWVSSSFICKNCFDAETITLFGKEQLANRPFVSNLSSKTFCLGNFPSHIVDDLIKRKSILKNQSSKFFHFREKIDLNFIEKNKLLDLTFHTRSQIIVLINFSKEKGLKKCSLNEEQKMILFLMKIKLNLPYRILSFLFDTSPSTVCRVFEEVLSCLSDFADRFNSNYDPECLLTEHTTYQAKKIYGDETLVLVADGTYWYCQVQKYKYKGQKFARGGRLNKTRQPLALLELVG